MKRQHSYRDGIGHTRERAEQTAAQLLAEGKRKLAGQRNRIPHKLKRELAALEKQLGQMKHRRIETLDDASRREQQTEDYRNSLSAALLIVEESNALAPQRIKRFGWLAMLSLVPVGMLILFKAAEFSKFSARCARATPPASVNHAALLFDDEPRCEYRSNAECAATSACKHKGLCSLRDGGCHAASNESCQASTECKTMGRCSLVGRSCLPVRDSDCRTSNACEHSGACTAWGDECIVTRDEDCAQSAVCRQRGKCGLSSIHNINEAQNVPNERDPPVGTCVPRERADCIASTACAKHGYCSLEGIDCLFTRVDQCPDSKECRIAGRCAWYSGSCVALTDEHCSASNGCKLNNRCIAYKGRCRVSAHIGLKALLSRHPPQPTDR